MFPPNLGWDLLTTCNPLSLKKYFGENLVVKRKLDQALIGGFLAKSGGDVFDASIKGKLEDLKNQIL